MDYPRWFLRRMLFITIGKGEADRVREFIVHGADPNWTTRRGTPALICAIRNRYIVESAVVKALLENGADPNATDTEGHTALHHARRRLAKFVGRPRAKPRRSPSLTPGGELRLQPHEWEFIDQMEKDHPGFAEDYLDQRRKAAERQFDTRGNLERIVPMLEAVTRNV
jgi:hypothetical protein